MRWPSEQQGQPQEVHCTNMQGSCVCQNGAATRLYTKKNPRDMVIGVLIAGETVVIFWKSCATEMSPNICQFMISQSMHDENSLPGWCFKGDLWSAFWLWHRCAKIMRAQKSSHAGAGELMGDADITAIRRDKLYWDILQSLHFGLAGFLSYWTALLLSHIVSDKNTSGEVVKGKYVSWTLKCNERCKMDKLAKRVLMCASIYSVQIWP